MIISPGILWGNMQKDKTGQSTIQDFCQPVQLLLGQIERSIIRKNKAVSAEIEMVIDRPQQAAVAFSPFAPDVVVPGDGIVRAIQRCHRLLKGTVLCFASRCHQIAEADQKIDPGLVDLLDNLCELLVLTLAIPEHDIERGPEGFLRRRGQPDPLPTAALHGKVQAGR